MYMKSVGNVWNKFILTRNLGQWRLNPLQYTTLGNSCLHPKVASTFQNGLKSSLFRDRHGIPSYVLLNLVNSVSADDFSIYGKEVGVAKSKVNFTHVTNRSR